MITRVIGMLHMPAYKMFLTRAQLTYMPIFTVRKVISGMPITGTVERDVKDLRYRWMKNGSRSRGHSFKSFITRVFLSSR